MPAERSTYWVSKASTILYCWLPGHAFGLALAAVLAGDLEPGGRLPITIAGAPDGYPAYDTVPDSDGKLYYRDSYFVGYHGFDAARAQSAFCFGHGIGYTDFSYERLTTLASHVDVNESLTASVVVLNTGTRSGKEVVQLYVPGPAHGIPRGPRQLAAFASVNVPATEAVSVDLNIGRRRLAHWDIRRHRWHVEPGDCTLHVGGVPGSDTGCGGRLSASPRSRLRSGR